MSEFNHVSQAVLAILLGLSLSACTQTGNQTAAETAAAVASIHFLAMAELLCVVLGIIAVGLLPKRNIVKES